MSSAVACVFTYPSCVIIPILANLPAATPKISCVGSQASDAKSNDGSTNYYVNVINNQFLLI